MSPPLDALFLALLLLALHVAVEVWPLLGFLCSKMTLTYFRFLNRIGPLGIDLGKH